jgi:hypothetical protein
MTIEAKLDRIIEILEAAVNPPVSKAGRKARGEVDGKAVAPAVKEEAVTETLQETSTKPATTAAAPVGNKDEMKKAVLAYRDATDQATALKLLTAVGAENFGAVKPEFYQQVQDAAVAALAALKTVVKEVDPFGDDDEPAAAAVTLTLKDVKEVFKKRQAEVTESALLGVLTELGAVSQGAPGQPPAPSLKALTADKFAAAVAAVNALPKTK